MIDLMIFLVLIAVLSTTKEVQIEICKFYLVKRNHCKSSLNNFKLEKASWLKNNRSLEKIHWNLKNYLRN